MQETCTSCKKRARTCKYFFHGKIELAEGDSSIGRVAADPGRALPPGKREGDTYRLVRLGQERVKEREREGEREIEREREREREREKERENKGDKELHRCCKTAQQ